MTPPRAPKSVVSNYASCVALSYVALALSGAFVTLPTLAALSQVGTGRLPDGDRALFEPGALLLLEVLRVGRSRLMNGSASSAMMAVIATLMIVPVTAAVIVRLNHEPLDWRSWLARTLPHVPTFLMLGGTTMLARASVLVVLALLVARTHDVLLVASGPRAADLALLGGGLAGALGIGVLGACQDLARAVAIAQNAFGWDALRGGLTLARRYPLRCSVPWLTAVGATLAAALLVAWAAAAFDLSRHGACRPLADFLLAQAAIAFALTARIWWFDRALGLARTLV